jgi:hypothetical protein
VGPVTSTRCTVLVLSRRLLRHRPACPPRSRPCPFFPPCKDVHLESAPSASWSCLDAWPALGSFPLLTTLPSLPPHDSAEAPPAGPLRRRDGQPRSEASAGPGGGAAQGVAAHATAAAAGGRSLLAHVLLWQGCGRSLGLLGVRSGRRPLCPARPAAPPIPTVGRSRLNRERPRVGRTGGISAGARRAVIVQTHGRAAKRLTTNIVEH